MVETGDGIGAGEASDAVERAKHYLASADTLDPAADSAAATLLTGEALWRLLLAWAITRLGYAPSDASNAREGLWEALVAANVSGRKAGQSAALTFALSLGPPQSLTAPSLSGAEPCEPNGHRMRLACDRLLQELDVTPRRARTFTRMAMALACVTSLCWLALQAHWLGLFRTNIALGKPVRASSQEEGTGPSSGATNGVIEPSFGLHTRKESGAWVSVDLGHMQDLAEIRVAPRYDGYHGETPKMAMEVSPDGSTFYEIASGSGNLVWRGWWVVKPGVAGRYVRLRTLEKGYIAISEIEVYH